MNHYTKLFHDEKFPGYQPKNPVAEDDFWNRHDLPFVEIPNVISTTKDYLDVKQRHKELFAPLDTQINREKNAEHENRRWYFTPHSQGWEQCIVVGDRNRETIPLITDTDRDQPKIFFDPTPHRDVLFDVRAQIDRLGMTVKRLMILALHPDGYVQPHIDPKIQQVPRLSYFWIPLNDSSPSLKIWPHGYVNHRAGNIYLFNNNTWVHSVINQDQQMRYVLTGLIDTEKCSNDFYQLAVKSAKKQWSIGT